MSEEYPYGYSLDEMDVEAFFNARAWLESALAAKGAEITGAGIGMGQADLDVILEGHPYNVAIKPIKARQNADGQAGQEVAAAPSQEGHAAGPACSAPEGEYVPLTAEQKSALNRAHLASVKVVTPAPDDALVRDIAYNARFLTPKRRFDSHEYSDIAVWAIREYIRRSTPKATHEREEPDDFMEEGDGSWCHDSDMGAR